MTRRGGSGAGWAPWSETTSPSTSANCVLGIEDEAAIHQLLDYNLRAAGFRVRDVHTVIVTHSHPDHFGAAGRIRREADAALITHRAFTTWSLDRKGHTLSETEAERIERRIGHDREVEVRRAPVRPAHPRAESADLVLRHMPAQDGAHRGEIARLDVDCRHALRRFSSARKSIMVPCAANTRTDG